MPQHVQNIHAGYKVRTLQDVKFEDNLTRSGKFPSEQLTIEVSFHTSRYVVPFALKCGGCR